MKLRVVELRDQAWLPGRVRGQTRWESTLGSSEYDMTKDGDMVIVRHIESGDVAIYPWSQVRFALPEPVDPQREAVRPQVQAKGRGK